MTAVTDTGSTTYTPPSQPESGGVFNLEAYQKTAQAAGSTLFTLTPRVLSALEWGATIVGTKGEDRLFVDVKFDPTRGPEDGNDNVKVVQTDYGKMLAVYGPDEDGNRVLLGTFYPGSSIEELYFGIPGSGHSVGGSIANIIALMESYGHTDDASNYEHTRQLGDVRTQIFDTEESFAALGFDKTILDTSGWDLVGFAFPTAADGNPAQRIEVEDAGDHYRFVFLRDPRTDDERLQDGLEAGLDGPDRYRHISGVASVLIDKEVETVSLNGISGTPAEIAAHVIAMNEQAVIPDLNDEAVTTLLADRFASESNTTLLADRFANERNTTLLADAFAPESNTTLLADAFAAQTSTTLLADAFGLPEERAPILPGSLGTIGLTSADDVIADNGSEPAAGSLGTIGHLATADSRHGINYNETDSIVGASVQMLQAGAPWAMVAAFQAAAEGGDTDEADRLYGLALRGTAAAASASGTASVTTDGVTTTVQGAVVDLAADATAAVVNQFASSDAQRQIDITNRLNVLAAIEHMRAASVNALIIDRFVGAVNRGDSYAANAIYANSMALASDTAETPASETPVTFQPFDIASYQDRTAVQGMVRGSGAEFSLQAQFYAAMSARDMERANEILEQIFGDTEGRPIFAAPAAADADADAASEPTEPTEPAAEREDGFTPLDFSAEQSLIRVLDDLIDTRAAPPVVVTWLREAVQGGNMDRANELLEMIYGDQPGRPIFVAAETQADAE